MELDSLQGNVERVTFHSEDSGYSVIRVKARGHRDLVTVLGHCSTISPGEGLQAYGEWIMSKEYGRQFRAHSLKVIAPNTIEGIEKYLGSGMVKGIGPHFAKKLVAAFGEAVFDVIEQTPKRLFEVQGVGPKRVERITSAWKDQKVIRNIMVFLQGHGVSTAKSARIFKTYGEKALDIVQENPYRLARDINGIGFKSADIIAQKLGIAKDSMLRARAGLEYVLREKMGDGHCAYPETKLIEESATLLEITQEKMQLALMQEIEAKTLVYEKYPEGQLVFLSSVQKNESEVANRVRVLANGNTPWPEINLDKALAWAQEKMGLTLAPAQVDAIKLALISKVAIITGGPGTGKSTLTKAIVQILRAKNMRLGLCSPTGRAAKRLSECTGLEAKTVHRLLGVDRSKGGFQHHQDNPLELDFLLVDEASMLDLPLFCALVRALPNHCALMLMGDVDQLPSVGPGRILGDLIDSKVFPTVKLTEIFRQAATSLIIKAAHAINRGDFPDLKATANGDFFFLESEEPEKTVEMIEDLVARRLPQKFGFDAVGDIQVLCPMQRGSLGARNLNERLAKKLNPNPAKVIEKFGFRFGIGDKVMVMENDYDKEVFNGDMGFIRDIDEEEMECIVEIDGKEVSFPFGELDILSPAYTITIHKSQGSEYPVVVIPVATQHFMMLKRNLLYTGVTRGKKLVVLVGTKKALAIAIKNQDQSRRYTLLKSRLQSLC